MKGVRILSALIVSVGGFLLLLGAARDSGSDLERARDTMTSLRNLGVALEVYKVDVGFYPPGKTKIEELERIITPTYLKEVPKVDGWGNPLQVVSGADGGSYTIWSNGSDGKKDAKWDGGGKKDLTRDIVFSDGMFYQWPEELAK